MKTRKRNRLMALALCLCMMVTMLPLAGMTFAAEPCPNHAAHDDTCGFVQTVEGHECGHAHDDTCGYAEGMGDAPCKHEQGEHDESCGYAPPSEEAPCGHTHDESCGEPDENDEYPGCAHQHDGGCGYAPAGEGAPCAHTNHDGDCGYGEAKEGAACGHAHDADCGYIAAVEGQPCGHTCELCGGGKIAGALPFGEELAATYSISGRVEPVGFPWQGLNIEVTLWYDGQQIGSVMADRGEYSFTSLVPGTYTVKTGGSRAGNGIYYKEKSETVVITDYDEECKFKLEPGNAPSTYSISGSVVPIDAYSEGLSIEVTLWQDDQQVGSVMSSGRRGNYSFTSLAPGTYTVKTGGSWADGIYYKEQSETVVITDYDQKCEFFLETGNAPGAYSISGSVMAAGSTVGLSIGVTLWQDGRQVGGVMSDGRLTGNYSFTSLAPGTYTVRAGGGRAGNGVYYTEQIQTVTLTDHDINCDFSLESGNAPATYSISGIIALQHDGAKIPNFPVKLYQKDVEQPIQSATTNALGEYVFSSVVAGDYTVRAGGLINGRLYSEVSQPVSITDQNIININLFLARAPSAPQNFQATPGDKQVALSWTAPASSGSAAITKYEVSKDDGGSWTDASSPTGHTFTGLTNGIYDTFQVRAVNSVGAGEAASATAAPSAVATVPSLPQNFNATPGNWQVDLSWTAPNNNGGAKITKYEVSKDDGGSWTDASSATGHTFLNLVNGKDYTFQVRAVNSAGAGDAAQAMATPETPDNAPSAPLNFTAVHGIWNNSIKLSWDTPADNGGAEIIKYQLSKDNGETWIDGHYYEIREWTFEHLINSQSYTFQVRAVNSDGVIGEAASVTAVAYTVPGQPQNLTAIPGDGQVTLTWEPPESDGGLEITSYRYNYSSELHGGSFGWDEWATVSPDEMVAGKYTATVTGLTNGINHIFFVSAVNAIGEDLSARVVAIPNLSVPTAPQNFQANPGDQQVALSWTAPASNGGAEISGYEVSKDGGTSWEDASSKTGHIFTGLNNGKSYTFQVRAVNSVGTGAAASVTAMPQAYTYTLTVTKGTDVTASGPYAAGANVNIRANVPADGKLFEKWTSSGGGKFADAFSPETTFTMPAGNVTVTAAYADDQTAPTGTITVKDNGWTEFLNTITFGVFFKETQEVAISAQDNSGQEAAIAYHMADAALTLEQVQALAEGQWTAYADKFSIAPNTKLVIYARLTDKAGNVTYISSNGIVLDDAAPSFSLEDGKTYDSAQTLNVTDNYALASVKLGETEQLSPDFTGAETQIVLNVNGAYTIEATDKAGNTASITVTIDISVVTAPNLTGITAPTAITGVANGTPLAGISLPEKVAITTTEGDKQAGVTWDRNTATPAYNPDSETAQTFTVNGTVTLPDGVTNTNGVSLTVTIRVTVEAKGTITITGLEIKSNPNKTTYTEGEALDLTGLSVKLTFSDGGDKTVALADFAANNITATPANGAKLSMSDTAVTVSTGGKSAGFPITVNAMQ